MEFNKERVEGDNSSTSDILIQTSAFAATESWGDVTDEELEALRVELDEDDEATIEMLLNLSRQRNGFPFFYPMPTLRTESENMSSSSNELLSDPETATSFDDNGGTKMEDFSLSEEEVAGSLGISSSTRNDGDVESRTTEQALNGSASVVLPQETDITVQYDPLQEQGACSLSLDEPYVERCNSLPAFPNLLHNESLGRLEHETATSYDDNTQMGDFYQTQEEVAGSLEFISSTRNGDVKGKTTEQALNGSASVVLPQETDITVQYDPLQEQGACSLPLDEPYVERGNTLPAFPNLLHNEGPGRLEHETATSYDETGGRGNCGSGSRKTKSLICYGPVSGIIKRSRRELGLKDRKPRVVIPERNQTPQHGLRNLGSCTLQLPDSGMSNRESPVNQDAVQQSMGNSLLVSDEWSREDQPPRPQHHGNVPRFENTERTKAGFPKRERNAPKEKYANFDYCMHCGALGVYHTRRSCPADPEERKEYKRSLIGDTAFPSFGVNMGHRRTLHNLHVLRSEAHDQPEVYEFRTELYNEELYEFRRDRILQDLVPILQRLRSAGNYREADYVESFVLDRLRTLGGMVQFQELSTRTYLGIQSFLNCYRH